MNKPVRLNKKDNFDKTNFFCDSSINREMGAWLNRHALLILFISIIIFSLIFVALIYALVGVSATEANTYYYHMNSI